LPARKEELLKRIMLVSAPALAAALLFTACGLFGGAEDDYYPMTVGNMWNYHGVITYEQADADTGATFITVAEVTAETQLTNGEDVFELTNLDSTFTRPPDETTLVNTRVNYARKTDDHVLAYDSKDDTEPDTVLALPLEDGKTWTVSSKGDTTITATVDGQESITVPAGTYECWKVRMTLTVGSTSQDVYWWYAEGVGHVKHYFEATYGAFTETMKSELAAFDIK
jgi:hypothetical protein